MKILTISHKHSHLPIILFKVNILRQIIERSICIWYVFSLEILYFFQNKRSGMYRHLLLDSINYSLKHVRSFKHFFQIIYINRSECSRLHYKSDNLWHIKDDTLFLICCKLILNAKRFYS